MMDLDKEIPKTWGKGLPLQNSCHHTQTPRMLSLLIFEEGGKSEKPVENPPSRDVNQQQTQI